MTLAVDASQLDRDDSRDLILIDSRLRQIEDAPPGSIAGSLWLLDQKGMRVPIDGIRQLADIPYLMEDHGSQARGESDSQAAASNSCPLALTESNITRPAWPSQARSTTVCSGRPGANRFAVTE